MLNPNLQKSFARNPIPSNDVLWEGIIVGNRALLSQAITLIESTNILHRKQALELLSRCNNVQQNSFRIGITGVPGVGKSTFIESFGHTLLEAGCKLAVLAIDPSSAKTKGSILGDKTRMTHLASNPNVFIRPTATGTTLGGVAGATREAIRLCEAAGFDTILVETVGVGQSEIEVNQLVDCFLLLLLAGAGDELQGIKRGIMEMADILAITKADGSNVVATQKAKQELVIALKYFQPNASGWKPSVLSCSALEKKGLNAIWEKMIEFKNHHLTNGYFELKRNQQHLAWYHQSLQQQMSYYWQQNEDLATLQADLENAVIKGNMMAPIAAQSFFENWLSCIKLKNHD